MSIKRGILIIGLAGTFIPVSTVFADDSEDFVACQQIKPKGKVRPMKEKMSCFRDLARQRESELNEIRDFSNTEMSMYCPVMECRLIRQGRLREADSLE